MRNNINLLLVVILVSIVQCQSSNKEKVSKNGNEVRNTEFDPNNPNQLADKVLSAMGGAENWNKLSYVSWTFFGARHLIWDKKNGRVRIESPKDSSIYLIDLNTKLGRYQKGGVEVKEPKLLGDYMKRAEGIWINDMYWLFMPFKLNDEGVNLKYLREDSVGANLSTVLEMTFNEVGRTPENKYELYIDQTDHLVKQWTFFESYSDSVAYATWPWDNYKSVGDLLLSYDRSDSKGPSNVRIYDNLSNEIFNSFAPFDFY